MDKSDPKNRVSRLGIFQKLWWFTGNVLLLPFAAISLIFSANVTRIGLSDAVFSASLLAAIYAATLFVFWCLSGRTKNIATILALLFIGIVLGKYITPNREFFLALACLILVTWMQFNKQVGPAADLLIKYVGVGCLCYSIYDAKNHYETIIERPSLLAQVESRFQLPQMPSQPPAVQRDVYYIILDRYARADQLKKVYGFDNSDFLQNLRSRGFVVAEKSYSNYQRTGHSLSSSLNLDYHGEIGIMTDKPLNDWLPIYEMIKNSVTFRFFKQQQYDFHFFGSWWEPTRKNATADKIVNYRAWPELLRVLFENSILGKFALNAEFKSVDPRYLQCERVKRKFDAITRTADSNETGEPKFVFAHFLVPHPPYVIGADGKCLSVETVQSRSREINYIEQVKFANSQVLKFLDSALNTKGAKPIIIIQSDEGPWPEKYVRDEIKRLGRDVTRVEWLETTPSDLREKMAILNALYLPDLNDIDISDSMTPVNNLRLVLREYFDANLPPLPDKSFVYPNSKDLFRYHSVDEKLAQP